MIKMPKHIPQFEIGLAKVLEISPELKPHVEGVTFPAFFENSHKESAFEYLANSIISQQISGYAARAIKERFWQLFAPDRPTPEKVSQMDTEMLKSAGLSKVKSDYMQAVAQAFLSETLSDDCFDKDSDSQIVDKLVSCKGIGPWSAQMFLMFYLHRMDVFSPGDIGVQRGFKAFMKMHPELLAEFKILERPKVIPPPGTSKKALARQKLPDEIKHMEWVASNYSPYRTVFQAILWKMSEINLEVFVSKGQTSKVEAVEKLSTFEEPVKAEGAHVVAEDVLKSLPESSCGIVSLKIEDAENSDGSEQLRPVLGLEESPKKKRRQ